MDRPTGGWPGEPGGGMDNHPLLVALKAQEERYKILNQSIRKNVRINMWICAIVCFAAGFNVADALLDLLVRP